MGVYTVLAASAVEEFLTGYGLGPLAALEPIRAGIENTNYRVAAGRPERRYALTVFERAPAATVAETLALTAALAGRGVPCPAPVRGPDGALVGTLAGKPAALTPWIEGVALQEADPAALEVLGRAVAELHLAGQDLPFRRGGPHLAGSLHPLALRLASAVRPADAGLARLLEAEAEDQLGVPEELPAGVVHTDLFLDNVLFDGDPPRRVRAFLDFHLAGRGPWLFDLAVVLVSAGWAGAGVSGERARALLGGYRAVRPLEPEEAYLLPAYLRRAALRYLCLRIERSLLAPDRLVAGEGKDPGELARRLELLRAAPPGAHR